MTAGDDGATAALPASQTATYQHLTDADLTHLISGRREYVENLKARLREAQNELMAATVEKDNRVKQARGLPCGATVWPAPAYISGEQWAATGCTCVLSPGHGGDCVCECKRPSQTAASDEPAKASEHEYDPMPPQEQGEHPPCRVCGRPFSEHAKASEGGRDERA